MKPYSHLSDNFQQCNITSVNSVERDEEEEEEGGGGGKKIGLKTKNWTDKKKVHSLNVVGKQRGNWPLNEQLIRTENPTSILSRIIQPFYSL